MACDYIQGNANSDLNQCLYLLDRGAAEHFAAKTFQSCMLLIPSHFQAQLIGKCSPYGAGGSL